MIRRLKMITSILLLGGLVSSFASADVTNSKKVEQGVLFENVSSLLSPYSRSASGEGLGGVAWLDYNNDNKLDLYLTNGIGSANGLFKNNGDGTFTDVTIQAGVQSGSGHSGVVVGDIDNDGYVDILLTGEGRLVGPGQTPVKLFHNQGNGKFKEISIAAGISANDSAFAATMGDINGDGFLDIFIASPGHIPFITGPGTGESHPSKLYLNNGDLTFTDIAASAKVDGLFQLPGIGTVSNGACVTTMTDYNRDNKIDILVGNCNAFPPDGTSSAPVRPTPFTLYRNNGDLTFTDVTNQAGLNVPGLWMGLALGDIDNDGDIDFYSTSTGTLNGLHHALMRNNGDGSYTNIATASGVAVFEFGWGTTLQDFDNDGDLDLYLVGALPLFAAIGPGAGNPGRLFWNDGTGNYIEDTTATGINLSLKYTSGLASGDYDGDGFVDFVVMNSPWSAGGITVTDGTPVLLRNQGNRNNSITLKLIGKKSNRSAIGAFITIKSGSRIQVREIRAGASMASNESPWPTIGIRNKKSAKVTVTWPSGRTEKFSHVKAGKLTTLKEGKGKKVKKDKNHKEDKHH